MVSRPEQTVQILDDGLRVAGTETAPGAAKRVGRQLGELGFGTRLLGFGCPLSNVRGGPRLLTARLQRLLLTNTEEPHLAGYRAFVEHLDKLGLLGGVPGCLNLDGAGRGERLAIWFGPEPQADRVPPLVSDMGDSLTFPPPQAGEHTASEERSIPKMVLTLEDPEIVHRAGDVYETCELESALRVPEVTTYTLARLTEEGEW